MRKCRQFRVCWDDLMKVYKFCRRQQATALRCLFNSSRRGRVSRPVRYGAILREAKRLPYRHYQSRGVIFQRRRPLMFAMQTHHSRSEHHSSYPHSGCIIAKASPLLNKPEFVASITIKTN